jgi:hypothetical protein
MKYKRVSLSCETRFFMEIYILIGDLKVIKQILTFCCICGIL